MIVAVENTPVSHRSPSESAGANGRLNAIAITTELMDRIYRRQRYIYDATRKWFLLERDRLIDDLRPGHDDAVLEIGCGTGRNLILAAKRYPKARFFGIDVSTEMLTSAIDSIAQAGLSSRVRVAHADATSFDSHALFGAPKFERIVISYSLSMIPRWRAVLEAAVSLLAPGGRLLIVDFGDFKGLPAWFHILLRHWLAWFSVNPPNELESKLVELSARTGAILVVERPCRGYVQYATVELKEPREAPPPAKRR